MPVVEQSALIKAPMAVVMAALNDIERIPAWATVDGSVSKVQGRGVGMTYTWQYRFNAMNFQGQSEVIEQTPETLITRTSGDIDSLWTINLSPAGLNRTILQVLVEYTPPNIFIEILADSVLGQWSNPPIARDNMARFKDMVAARAAKSEYQPLAPP
jgi:uncharacterized membrane protein